MTVLLEASRKAAGRVKHEKIKKVTASRDDGAVGELTERRPLWGSRGAQQVPPLRFAPVGMTTWRVVHP